MRRSAILALACLAALAALTSPAFAAENGMLAAVAPDGKLVTLNPDGSGLHALWTPTAPITGLAWSPDGNKLALIAGGKLVVWDLPTGTSMSLPNDGDSDPTWSSDGASIGLRRGDTAVTISADFKEQHIPVDHLVADTFAWAPNLKDYAYTRGRDLFWSGMEDFALAPDVADGPAFSPDGQALAFVWSKPLSPFDQPGLYTRTPIGNNATPRLIVAGTQPRSVRWTPDGKTLLYTAAGEWNTVPAAGGTPNPIPGTAGVTLADWQPCGPDSKACVSYEPPRCRTLMQSVTTQAAQTIDLPAPDCYDPASLGLSFLVVTAPEHGTVTGQRYTPAPGFVGQDALTYRMSNGSGVSETVTVKIFVVPRPAPAVVLPAPRPATSHAPFLTARATPKLNRKRTVVVKLACDQSCSFAVRLKGQLKKGKRKTVKGSLVKRTSSGTGVLSLRLRLPKKPKGTLKTVWIAGTVRNAAGESRSVKLPVRLPH